jgi:hypothetical protein
MRANLIYWFLMAAMGGITLALTLHVVFWLETLK